MKRVVIGLMTLLIVAMLVLPGCSLMGGSDTPEPTAPVTPATLPQLQTEVGALKSQVATLSGQIATLNSQIAALPTTPTDVSTLQSNLSILQGQVAELSALIASLTTRLTTAETTLGNWDSGSGGSGTSGNGTVSTPITWYVSVSDWGAGCYNGTILLTPTEIDNIVVEVADIDPSRIKEADLYEIQVEIVNDNSFEVTLHDFTMELVFRPNGYAMVDIDNTYLDSDSSPYMSWDSDFLIREREGEEACRRITFSSDKCNKDIKVDAKTGTYGGYEILDLVFELYYGS